MADGVDEDQGQNGGEPLSRALQRENGVARFHAAVHLCAQTKTRASNVAAARTGHPRGTPLHIRFIRAGAALAAVLRRQASTRATVGSVYIAQVPKFRWRRGICRSPAISRSPIRRWIVPGHAGFELAACAKIMISRRRPAVLAFRFMPLEHSWAISVA